MRLIFAFATMLLLHCSYAEENGWSWGDKKEAQQETEQLSDQTVQQLDELLASASEYADQYALESIQQNATEVDKVVDEILVSNRQGRNLNGFDEVYTDPNVQEALQKGDDGEARNIIKERLCHLGLMQCDEQVQEKRPYISPEELIYAQPVAINPVGRPIPTIPIKGVRGGYGPPKPIPFPPQGGPLNKFGPPPPKFGPPQKFGPPGPPKLGPPPYAPNKPPRRGYGPPPSKPFYGPPGTKPFLDGEIYEGAEFSKPPPGAEIYERPYEFEQGVFQSNYNKDKKVELVLNAQGGSAHASVSTVSPAGLQEHIHHHYHHNLEGASKVPTVVVNPVPVAAVSAASTSESLLSNSFGSSHLVKPLTSSGFSPITSGSFGESHGLTIGGSNGFSGSGSLTNTGSSFGAVNSYGQTIGSSGFGSGSYGGQSIASYGGGSTGLNAFASKPVYENFEAQNFGSNSFGTSVGSYGNTGLYKKELSLNSGNSNYLQSNYADKYQGLESAKRENYDCVCVPYDQCPSHDVIGRKDDLYLPLDPRNLKSDIEAIVDEERVITDGNGTMTVVRIPKNANLNETLESDKAEHRNVEESKKVSKREASVDQKEDKDTKIEPRQYGGTTNNKKIKPTFGVSFGLPNQGGGGYPINPYGPNPHINPYGGSIGASGINLGLVSVNPLISVQVTKDDYGEKVVKPFVNLHVTPNNYLVHKFEDLLSYKKAIVFNKHKHLHFHKPNYYHHDPHYHHQGHPEIHHSPPGLYEYEGPQYQGHDYHGPPHVDHFGPPGPLNPPDFYPGGYEEYKPHQGSYYDDPLNYGGLGGGYDDNFYGRTFPNNTNYVDGNSLLQHFQNQYNKGVNSYGNPEFNDQLNSNELLNDQYNEGADRIFQGTRSGKSLLSSSRSSNPVRFPTNRKRRDAKQDKTIKAQTTKRQAYFGGNFGGRPSTCGPRHVCCRRPLRPHVPNGGYRNQCGTRHSQGINGRIKNPVYVDGDSEFGEYPWQVAILKKDPKESVYVCGGTLIDPLHIITAAHCVKTYTGYDLRVRLGEWDVNHDVEFFPYIERDITTINVHPEFYAGTLYNDLAILRMDKPVDFSKHPHISPACLPSLRDDYTGTRCWTTGWGKDAFGDFGKYQNILKEVDVPIVGHAQCQRQLQQTRLGYEFQLHPGFVCAGGEEGKDACKGDGGGPMVCERGGTWQVVGVVSWGIGCGQSGVPGVYVKVAHYLDWIRQITQRF